MIIVALWCEQKWDILGASDTSDSRCLIIVRLLWTFTLTLENNDPRFWLFSDMLQTKLVTINHEISIFLGRCRYNEWIKYRRNDCLINICVHTFLLSLPLSSPQILAGHHKKADYAKWGMWAGCAGSVNTTTTSTISTSPLRHPPWPTYDPITLALGKKKSAKARQMQLKEIHHGHNEFVWHRGKRE